MVFVQHQRFFNESSEIFGNLERVQVYIHDITVWAKYEQKMRDRQAVLERADSEGVKFNKIERKFIVTEVKYLGHVISSEGLKPDQDTIKATLELKSPKNKK